MRRTKKCRNAVPPTLTPSYDATSLFDKSLLLDLFELSLIRTS
ncbi:unnamed protein product, partial [Larinioides sclopetarius]